MQRRRADMLLVERGLAESRSLARAMIEAGRAWADGRTIEKPSTLLALDVALAVERPFPWVSRGGVKLAHALAAFAVNPAGRVCLDVGASTGGFTDVLLAHGAQRVYAVDVGRGQLVAKIRCDERVVVMEQTDSRLLQPTMFGDAPSLVVCDVSFISAAKALGAPLACAAPCAEAVVLVKPQFEAGPNTSKRGVLTQEQSRAAAPAAFETLNGLEGFALAAQCDSPILGGEGNLEFLVHLKRQ